MLLDSLISTDITPFGFVQNQIHTYETKDNRPYQVAQVMIMIFNKLSDCCEFSAFAGIAKSYIA